jgi:tetratricopeptide (TPR) repeat protein
MAINCGMAGRTQYPMKTKIRPLWLAAGVGILLVAALVLLALGRLPGVSIEAVSTLAPAGAEPAAGPTRNTSFRLPEAVDEALSGAQVYDHDDLDALLPDRWYASATGIAVEGGQLLADGAAGWATWWGAQRAFQSGDAVLVRFQTDESAQFEFHLERGNWAGTDYRRWALHVGNRFEMGIWEGALPRRYGQLVGTLALRPGTWYQMLMAIGRDGQFVTYVWEDGAEAPQLEYRHALSDGWADGGWLFGLGANRGRVTIDSVTEIAFRDLRRPDRAGAAFWDAVAAYDEGDYGRVLDDISTAVRQTPDRAPYYYYRGLAYAQTEQADLARLDFERAAALDPANDEYLRRLAWLDAEAGDIDAARDELERALALAPLEERNYLWRGLIRRDLQGDLAGALADFDRALELAPNEAELYSQRARTRQLLGDYVAGLADAAQCSELQPRYAECALAAARNQAAAGQADAAVASYQRYLELDTAGQCAVCRAEAQEYVAAHAE